MDENNFPNKQSLRTSTEIRETFLRFFESKGHYISQPMPIVSGNSDCIQFTTAGVDQYKDVLISQETIRSIKPIKVQPCLSSSINHDTIDNHHHSMFEMLGNWSFGDYFKKEAIGFAWQMLTDVYQIEKERLYTTVFEGNKQRALPTDEETFEQWKRYLSEDHIFPGRMETNWVKISGTNLFGPTSAIWYDNRPAWERNQTAAAELVNTGHPQLFELWNLAFIEYTSKKDAFIPLKTKCVDTGMGLERLVGIIQGKSSNYDTDLFQDLIGYVAGICGINYTGVLESVEDDPAAAMRTVVDHTRAAVFIIAYSEFPLNKSVDFLVNQLVRTSLDMAHKYLNVSQSFLHGLVPIIVGQFKGVYDQLFEKKDLIKQIILEKETEMFLSF